MHLISYLCIVYHKGSQKSTEKYEYREKCAIFRRKRCFQYNLAEVSPKVWQKIGKFYIDDLDKMWYNKSK